MNSVYLSLGSNMGDREENLKNAVRLISDITDTCVLKVSSIYETDPVGFTQQGSFLNMAVLINTTLSPLLLLEKLQEIETVLKRVRTIHWGPRTIDIDILLYEGVELKHKDLLIPHPRMFERSFVLVPLKEIYEGKDINGNSFDELVKNCGDNQGISLWGPFCLKFEK